MEGDETDRAALAVIEGGSISDEMARARHYAAEAFSPGTRRVYASAWKAFDGFCQERGVPSLPADGTVLALWLTMLADLGSSPRTLHVKAAAVAAMHAATRGPDGRPLPSPTETAEVRLVLKGIRREAARLGDAPERADPLLPDLIRKVLKAIDRKTSTRGVRDAAVILFGFASAMRRSELAALRVEDIEPAERGMLVRIPLSKGDQEGQGQAVAVPVGRDADMCPVRAMRAWLHILRKECSDRRSGQNMLKGRVFREVSTADRIMPGSDSLTPESVGRIVQRRAAAVGLEGRISAHSLRAGFATASLLRRAPIPKVKDHLRHKSVNTTLGYYRDLEKFIDHPGDGLL